MKKYIIIIFFFFLIPLGTLIYFNLDKIKPKGSGGLQVTTNVKSNVYLDDKLVGTTPFCKCTPENTVKEGEYILKIEPEDKSLTPFTYRIKIGKDVLTAVERNFLPGSLASASILNLEKVDQKQPEVLITSIPDGALVSIDSNSQGVTPFIIKDISASEHEIELNKDGFNKKTLKIRTVPSYKLTVSVILGTQADAEQNTTPSPTNTATASATVKIKDTPTGFLRVRADASISSAEVARVKPGDIFTFLEEQPGWFKIKLKDNTVGWISDSYAEKITQ